MYFNDCIFIHIPKTGGTSLSYYVLESLFGKDFLKEHGRYLSTRDGWKHAPLTSIFLQKEKLQMDPEKIKHVMVLFRNPYDKMVSLYYFYLQYFAEALLKNDPAQFELIKLPFNEWVVELSKGKVRHSWQDYKYFISKKDGTVPSNLIVLRYEDYEASVNKALELFGGKIDESVKLDHMLKTKRTRDFKSLYDEESEEVVYQLHKWVFDNGYYERMKL